MCTYFPLRRRLEECELVALLLLAPADDLCFVDDVAADELCDDFLVLLDCDRSGCPLDPGRGSDSDSAPGTRLRLRECDDSGCLARDRVLCSGARCGWSSSSSSSELPSSSLDSAVCMARRPLAAAGTAADEEPREYDALPCRPAGARESVVIYLNGLTCCAPVAESETWRVLGWPCTYEYVNGESSRYLSC